MSETHRHYWTPTDDGRYACTDCAETCEACIECTRWTGSSLLICEQCVRRLRRLIDDIETAIALHSPSPAGLIPAVRYDRDRITGSRSDEPDVRWTYGDLKPILDAWADCWAGAQGRPRTIKATDYLRGHIMWAAHHREDADWDQWLTEMRQALHTAKGEAGLLPKRMPAPCAHCGGLAVQTWASKDLKPHPTGLSDEVQCLGCKLTWRSAAQYRQVSKQHLQGLPHVQPDALVTMDEAGIVWPDIPIKTWRTWLNRGEMPDAVAWDVRGRPQYRVGDLDTLAERRLDETRKGRRAG